MTKPQREKPIEPTPSEAITEPEPTGHVESADEPKLPEGVQVHHANVLPSLPLDPSLDAAPDPKSPPRDHVGCYQRCGFCGDFLPEGVNACQKCAPAVVPSNIATISHLPAVKA